MLAAMGMTETAAGECVRFTFGWVNAAQDGDEAAQRVLEVVAGMR